MLFKNQSKQSVVARLLLLIPVIMISFAFQSSKPVAETVNLHKLPNPSQPTDTTLFTAVEVAPVPVGGMDAFYKFVGKNFNYPQAAQEAQVDGKVVLRFVVEKDGSLSGITVLQDIGHGTGEEAARMLKTSPNWKPGMQNGKLVRVQFTLPIQLNLAAKVNTPEDKPAEPSN